MIVLPSSPFSPSRTIAINSEVYTLLDKTAIAKVEKTDNQLVSPIFDVPKKDTPASRIILNLKFLNQFLFKSRFKLEGYQVIISMLRIGDFMVSIDLKDAYLMFSMFPEFFCFLCFDWEGDRYCYTSMPFGLSVAPRIFTKVMKAVLVFLRGRGVRVSAWFDDLIIVAESISLLLEHLKFCCLILRSLGFLINEEKSQLIPTQKLLHLGFIWDSASYSLSVPVEKVENLKLLCNKALSGSVSLRFLQRILGTIESLRLAFPVAALHYRYLQHEVSTLISSGENWDHKIVPSASSKIDLNWWCNCPSSLPPKSLAPFSHDIAVTTDSSTTGWGAFTTQNTEASGFWSDDEAHSHINVLEMKAIVFAFFSLFRDSSGVSILIKSDNTTAVAYVNHFGGVKSPEITDLVVQLYDFCIRRNITIKASYLAGRLNKRADALSRRTRDHCYSLPPSLFLNLCSHFDFKPSIDLFANRNNHKVVNYYSYEPDPHALAFDAFLQKWPNNCYAFPPISVLDRFLSYFITFSDIDALVIVPLWPSQAFFPTLLSLLIDEPLFFPAHLLEDCPKSLCPFSNLLACVISTSTEKQKDYLRQSFQNCYSPSTEKPYVHTSDTGNIFFIGYVDKIPLWAKSL